MSKFVDAGMSMGSAGTKTAFPLVGLLELRLVLFLHVFTTYIKTPISVQLTLSAKPRNWKACAAQTLGSSQALFSL